MNSGKNSPDTRQPRKVLGRGLSALLESRTVAASAPAPAPLYEDDPTMPGLHQLPIQDIAPNPDQPRRHFTAKSLQELAASIREHGVLQPVIVALGNEGKWVLIAGERRWRAAHIAGLERIPVIVVEPTPRDRSLELALIENLQREDLNPMEAAAAFERLVSEFRLTHEEVARRTGKDRATITNFVRLLRLPLEIQKMVSDGKLTMGHARALLSLPTAAEQLRIANEIVSLELTVRATENLVAVALAGGPLELSPRRPKPVDPNIRAAIAELERVLGTRVRLSGSAKKGKLVIEFYSAEDLMRIYDAISKS